MIIKFMEKRLDRIETKIDNLVEFRAKLIGISGAISGLISVVVHFLSNILR